MKLPSITSPMTYAEIRASLGIRERNELEKNPFALSIALARAVNQKKLKYRAENWITRWPLYGSGKREQPLRSKV